MGTIPRIGVTSENDSESKTRNGFRSNPWYGLARLLSAAIPVGLFISALTPNIITVQNAENIRTIEPREYINKFENKSVHLHADAPSTERRSRTCGFRGRPPSIRPGYHRPACAGAEGHPSKIKRWPTEELVNVMDNRRGLIYTLVSPVRDAVSPHQSLPQPITRHVDAPFNYPDASVLLNMDARRLSISKFSAGLRV
ncbi:hypothetical protein EVAR_60799_1 [Eumeta japonica]|uniref:Uncharacterized protein n=1 Tax=Eumeta variegata TaxID=151549 RepID=A0A4C1YMB8_EUMVA|nr:hypothetical protein EVAR_60799_1 [Eumeta japonica]